jgi:hypothetical protein
MTMNKMRLGLLAAALLLPATGFAHDVRPWRADQRYESPYRGGPWYETKRRGYWHFHRVPHPRRPGHAYFYHWHSANRFDPHDGRWDRLWYRWED